MGRYGGALRIICRVSPVTVITVHIIEREQYGRHIDRTIAADRWKAETRCIRRRFTRQKTSMVRSVQPFDDAFPCKGVVFEISLLARRQLISYAASDRIHMSQTKLGNDWRVVAWPFQNARRFIDPASGAFVGERF